MKTVTNTIPGYMVERPGQNRVSGWYSGAPYIDGMPGITRTHVVSAVPTRELVKVREKEILTRKQRIQGGAVHDPRVADYDARYRDRNHVPVVRLHDGVWEPFHSGFAI